MPYMCDFWMLHMLRIKLLSPREGYFWCAKIAQPRRNYDLWFCEEDAYSMTVFMMRRTMVCHYIATYGVTIPNVHIFTLHISRHP